MKNILITGGAGFIGTHTCLSLINLDYKITVIDNFSNSSVTSLRRVMDISRKKLEIIEGDIRDKKLLNQIFKKNNYYAVIHFAGLKSVSESSELPLSYYENNVYGSLTLLDAMKENNINKIIFSSSATVYGKPKTLPITESTPTGVPTNPYGMSKLMIENILQDLYKSDNSWKIFILRYFNPVGAHPSGKVGEDPSGIPNNLMPFISQVAMKKRKKLYIYGKDYNTIDGTGIRDYIHVLDLADGHKKALDKIESSNGINIINLGTGKGYSVLEIVRAFEQASKVNINYEYTDRRPGDVDACFADPSYAKKFLNWEATRNLLTMCEDAWRWQLKNPNGYEDLLNKYDKN